MLPQQPTGLVFVLLGDDLPPLISQQCHKEPTRRIPHPSRMHRGSHRVQLGRLAARQPAAGDGVLVPPRVPSGLPLHTFQGCDDD